ncbi:MAG: helix-turn-helix domain-containing protein [Lacipirellulaceae bacterium]
MVSPTGGGPPPLLTVRQAAERLSCSLASVYGAIERGELPAVRVGRRTGYRIDPCDLDDYINRRKTAPDPRVELTWSRPAPPPRALRHLRLD